MEPFLFSQTEEQNEATKTEKSARKQFISWLPTRHKVLIHLTQLLTILLLYSLLYGILEKDALPGSETFALLFLVVSSHLGGKCVSFIKLPSLIGMLIVGFLFRNLWFFENYRYISVKAAATLRSCALIVILLRAGLGLDSQKLRQLSRIVFQLAFIPCIVEAASCAFAAHFILDLPWIWAIMLGFIVAAVSPAVLVPGLLSLQQQSLGTKKGIPTLVIAASSIDDVLAITGFTIMLTMALSEGSNIYLILLKGLLEPVGGLVYGLFLGRIFWIVPPPSVNSSLFRLVLLVCGGGAALFVGGAVGLTGVGPMACLVLAFVAALHWKKEPDAFNQIDSAMDIAWQIFQPFLFGLIGAEISLDDIQNSLGSTVATLCVGLIFRIIAASFATAGGDLNVREKLFVALAWLPKATVQAAIGPQALDHVLRYNIGPEAEEYSQRILTAAVVSIVLTAPLGAALIALLGPILLTKENRPSEDRSLKIVETDEDRL